MAMGELSGVFPPALLTGGDRRRSLVRPCARVRHRAAHQACACACQPSLAGMQCAFAGRGCALSMSQLRVGARACSVH